MYRGNYSSPAMGPGPEGYEGVMKGSSVKKKKRVKTASSPADLLERIQKRLQSENFFDLNESDAMASPSSSNSRMKFNSNQQHNPSSGGPGQANAQGDMMLPRPLLPVPHPPRHSTHLASSHDYSYSGQHSNDYLHQQPELHSTEAPSSNGKRNLSSRLGPPALAGNEMHSGKKSVPFIPGLGDDPDMTGPEGSPSVASSKKPSITDFLDESFNPQDLEPAQTDYWKYGISESSSTSMYSKSSGAHSSASPAPDLLKNRESSSFNTEFKSGRSGTNVFFDNAGRGHKNSALSSTFGKDVTLAYSGSDSSRRSHQKITVCDYSSTSDKRGRASSKGLHSRDTSTSSRHVSPFVTKIGRTGSLLSPSGTDLGTSVAKSGRTGSLILRVSSDKEKDRGSSTKWEKRLSGYEKCLGKESRLSKNWKKSSEGREKESAASTPDDSSITSDHASEIDIPREALQCHVCRLQNFSSRHAYNKHLLSSHHQHMFQLLGVRNDNLEAFKRAAAKLSSRALEYEVMDDGSVKEVQGASGTNFIRCSYCFATVLNTAVDAHNQLLQHKELVEFTRPLCCGIKFINRQSYESHKNTAKHLAKKFAKEKEFISHVICQIDEEMMESKMSQSNADREKLNRNSLDIPQSTYIKKILEKIDSDPCIQDDKSNYCLVCEVSVPEFRRLFHPSCADHHENKHTFCTVNKSRIAVLIAKVLSEIDQPNKSANTGVSDQNKLGRYPLSSKLISHAEKKNSTIAPEVEGGDDFEYDFKCVSSNADGKSKSLVVTKQMGVSTSDGDEVCCPQPANKEPDSLECITPATSDIKAITESTDMEIASPDGSVEDGQFEYEFGGTKSTKDEMAAKPVTAIQGHVREVKQTIEEEKMSTSGENVDERDEEFDYEFSSTESKLGDIVPPVVVVTKENADRTNSKLQSDKKVSVTSRASAVTNSSAKAAVKGKEKIRNTDSCRSSQKMRNKTEKTKSVSLELGNDQKEKSKDVDEALKEFYVQVEDTDVLKGAAPPQSKNTASSTGNMQAQDEKDIDDEIDDFDYQFDDSASEECLPTAQASTLAPSIDTIATDIAEVEPALVTTKTWSQTMDSDRDETKKAVVPDEANSTEEDEFEYIIEEEKIPDDCHLNNQVAKTNEYEEKSVDSKYAEKVSENSPFDYQMEEKKSSEEDQFEYQMEEETNVEKAGTVIQAETSTTGEDGFEYEVEEDVADGGEFEYQLDDEADEEFEYEEEEKGAEEDEFDYQMEDQNVVDGGKIDKINPVLPVEQVSNVDQDEQSGEDKFEYQMEAANLEESIDNKEKHAKKIEVKSNEMNDKLAHDSDLDYEMSEETKTSNDVKDIDDEGADEFEYELVDGTVAEEEEFDCKLDETSKEKDLDTNVDEDEFEYNLVDESDGVENIGISNTGDLCEGKDPSEFGEEEEFAFDYELPDDEVDDDPKQSTTSKKCAKLASKENSTITVDFTEKDTEPFENEFDYDVEEYETEISTVSRALGKVSDEVKEQMADDNNSSDETQSSNQSSEKIESAKASPLKFKIPPVAPYSSEANHDDAVDPDLCENVKSAIIPSVSDEINVMKPQEETAGAVTSTVASPSIDSATPSVTDSSISPKLSLGKSPVRLSKRTQSRSPARGSTTSPSPACKPLSPLNSPTAASPVRASTSCAKNLVLPPYLTATLPADLGTEVMGKIECEKYISDYQDSVVSLEKIINDDIEDKDDIVCKLPKDSKTVKSLKIISEQDVLSDQIEQCKQDVESNPEAVKFLESKSIQVEKVESTPVKVNVVDSENVKMISEKNEDDEATSRSRISKARARPSRSTPVKSTGFVPLDDGTETVGPVFRRVGTKRGRAATPTTAAEKESQENEEHPETQAKRPARNRNLKIGVEEESKETVEILLEVIDEEQYSSPQKKGKAARRNVKGRTLLLTDSDNDASETLPAFNHEEEDMKEDEEKMTSPRGRRGGRARRGNSTRVFPKKLSVFIDAEEDHIDEGKDAEDRKREAPTNSDDEGSECSVTRGGRPSKRGRGGASVRGTATPKTPALATSRKMSSVTRTPAVSAKATPAAVVTPQPGSGGKGKQTSTPAVGPRFKRRSCAPARYE